MCWRWASAAPAHCERSGGGRGRCCRGSLRTHQAHAAARPWLSGERPAQLASGISLPGRWKRERQAWRDASCHPRPACARSPPWAAQPSMHSSQRTASRFGFTVPRTFSAGAHGACSTHGAPPPTFHCYWAALTQAAVTPTEAHHLPRPRANHFPSGSTTARGAVHRASIVNLH